MQKIINIQHVTKNQGAVKKIKRENITFVLQTSHKLLKVGECGREKGLGIKKSK